MHFSTVKAQAGGRILEDTEKMYQDSPACGMYHQESVMEDEEPMEGYEPGEERCIVLRVPKPPPPPK
ncbi:hypothetical protein DOY81_015204, partial [Sarcophaga bullata]